MDEQKLTDWYPPEVLPARPGCYLREYYPDEQHWMNDEPDYFDGESWFYGGVFMSLPLNLRWRGLAEPPLTDWFEDGVRPAHPGVYEKEPPEGDSVKWFQYWDGERWWYGGDTPEETAEKFESRRSKSWPTPRRWRGLAVQP